MPDTADALILAELRRLNAGMALLLARSSARPDPKIERFLTAVDASWGNGAFRCGELVLWASDPAFTGRRAVLESAHALLELGDGAPVTAHRLGLRLAALAAIAADGLMLERVEARERGSRLWRVTRCASSG